MAAYKSWGYLGFILLVCSQWLHIFSADNNQPSKIPEVDVSKPALGSWNLPTTPKPKPRRGHREGGGGRRNGECICNCNCDCEKTRCKYEGRNKGNGPVVCMPMDCNRSGCKFRADMNIEANNNFQIPYFMMNGEDPMGPTKSSGSMNITEAGHH